MKCKRCKKLTIHSEEVTYDFKNNKYLLVRINNYVYINNKLVKLSNKIINFDVDKIVISNNQNDTFKIISAITYVGTSYEGHYAIWVRSGSGWNKISDKNSQIYPFFVKYLKDVYLLVLCKN